MRSGGRRRTARITALHGIAVLVAAGSLAGGCSSAPAEQAQQRADGPSGSSTSTSTSTTTTTSATTTTVDPDARVFEPLVADPDLPLRDQVEQAYLFHWEVLMDALRTGRTDQLHLAYSGEALPMRTDEIESAVADGFRVGGRVEHNYEISVHNETEATVMDAYRNHMVEIDPESAQPREEPTGDQVLYEYNMRKDDDQWRIDYVVRHELPG